MARQILDEGVEGGAQVGGREGLPNASLEVEKGSFGAAALGRPIRVEEEALARGHGEGLHLRAGRASSASTRTSGRGRSTAC